jgi:hypothetical protein
MKLKNLGLVLSSMVFFTGCQATQSMLDTTKNTVNGGFSKIGSWVETAQLNDYEKIQNKEIRNKFTRIQQTEGGRKKINLPQPLLDAKFTMYDFNPTSIHLSLFANHEGNFAEANRWILRGNYKSQDDLPAKYFIAQAKEKGHEVRQYKAAISERVNKGLKPPIEPYKGSENLYGVDPVFVEYDKDGNVVAIMTRSWQSLSAIGVDSRLFTSIYFGEDATNWFQNYFTNYYLENALQRVYK